MVKELQFDKEKLVTNEGPLETLKPGTKNGGSDTYYQPYHARQAGYGDYNFAEGGTWHIIHPCPNPLSLLLRNAGSQVSRDRLPLIYEFLAKCGEGLKI